MGQPGGPAYFAVIMGVWKVPGAVFTYTGAGAFHLAPGQIIFAVIALASWALRP